jgi:hypothetical protein
VVSLASHRSVFKVVLVTLFFSCAPLWSQHDKPDYSYVDDVITVYSSRGIADRDSLVAFVTSTFTSPAERVRAFYTWIALNILYDKDLLDHYRLSSSLSLQSLSSQRTQHPDTVLKYRLAVCEGICQLMNSCCEKAGIRSRMIGGITRLENVVDEKLLHTWNAVQIDSTWKLLDITWSGGHINLKGEYVRKFNDRYFFRPPVEFIVDHWPLDAMWQLLERPVSKKEFIEGVAPAAKAHFNYQDSINAYLRLKKQDQEYVDLLHYHASDPGNENYTLTADYYIYNRAVAIFNRSSLYFEDYMEYARKLEGKPVTRRHTIKCIQLLKEPAKILEEGLNFSRARSFFHADLKKKFDEMVASSFQRYREVNRLLDDYQKLLKSFN